MRYSRNNNQSIISWRITLTIIILTLLSLWASKNAAAQGDEMPPLQTHLFMPLLQTSYGLGLGPELIVWKPGHEPKASIHGAANFDIDPIETDLSTVTILVTYQPLPYGLRNLGVGEQVFLQSKEMDITFMAETNALSNVIFEDVPYGTYDAFVIYDRFPPLTWDCHEDGILIDAPLEEVHINCLPKSYGFLMYLPTAIKSRG